MAGAGGDMAGVSDLGGFCGNPNTARAEVNGMLATAPLPNANLLFLNCCEAAEISLLSMQLKEPLLITWRHFVNQPPNLPATLDLAKLPQSWNVSLSTGCTTSTAGCVPSKTYNTGLTGTLTVSGDFNGYQMSVCLSVDKIRVWVPIVRAM
jgi:hypothetical protein